ncbi:MAG: HD domain-containing protein [Bacilli bacterium]|nr:HD domain-containing protein [Bacilli bacterium]
MSQMQNDNEYTKIVGHILDNEEFNKIKTIEHHGISRFDHSVKVSYYSYKIAKALKLDYYDVARAGLLHDFFLSDDERTTKDRFLSTFVHPKKAEKHADQIFGINEREADIIRTHMFPVNMSVPKYAESWVVNFVDKAVGGYEFSKKFGYKLSYAANLYLIFLFNSLK